GSRGARGQRRPVRRVAEASGAQALKPVTLHDVRHTRGLRPNFRSSIDTPLDKLYDKSWTKKHGVFSSVMDYPSVNVSPEGRSEDGYYYNPGVGTYDR